MIKQKKPKRPMISVEDALTKVGGFGKQQWTALFALLIARQCANVFVYTFPFFIFPQKYFCKDQDGSLFKCSMEYVCGLHKEGQFVDYVIDKSWVWYNWNWY